MAAPVAGSRLPRTDRRTPPRASAGSPSASSCRSSLLAVLVGAGCGLLGAVLALPTVPLFAEPRDASTLDLSAPWGSVLAVLVAALLVLGLVAWLCGRTVAARARLSRVREVL